MSRENYAVFSTAKIGNLDLKNRLIRSATCEYKMAEDGSATEIVLDIYRKLANGGVGMIITGLMAVTQGGKGVSGQACIDDDRFIVEIAKIAEAVHNQDNNCAVVAQLCHSGRQLTHENTTADCVGPTAMSSPLLEKKARELSGDEVETIITAFVNGIIRAEKAGFDGAQLHGAHGYLLSSFLSPYTNQRRDCFGGSTQNRVQIIKAIVERARKTVGDFPILIKVNCDDHVVGGITKASFPELISELSATGVDAIEISGGIWDCLVRSEEELGFVPVPIPESRTQLDKPEKQSYYYSYVNTLNATVPLILVGGNRNIEALETIIQEQKVDFISMSRPLIAEPGLPERWLQGVGSDKANCVSCNACLLYKDAFGCALKRLKFNRKEFEAGYAEGWKAVFK